MAANTLIEKIILKNAGKENVVPGETVSVKPDAVMIHDLFFPFVIQKFEQMGFSSVWQPDRVVLVYDHLVPAATMEDIRHFTINNAYAQKYGITKIHRADGICHQLMVEQGHVGPGDVAFGTDSHTTTYGAVGAFSSGIGYTEMAAILGTGELWIRVPATIRVTIDGELPPFVSAKDIILTLLGDIGADGAVYRALEFTGSTVEAMSVSSRMTIANMAIEAGAKCAVFVPDGQAAAISGKTGWEELRPDKDARYESVINYRAEDLVPVAACPSKVDSVKPVEELVKDGIHVDQVFIGSCTNGRYEDLAAAANILRGKKIAPSLRLLVTPASRAVYAEAAKTGVLADLIAAGATVTSPSCGLCCGRTSGILAPNEVVVATNNRNFMGRMGDASVKIYLTSPAVAAATALTGVISQPQA